MASGGDREGIQRRRGRPQGDSTQGRKRVYCTGPRAHRPRRRQEAAKSPTGSEVVLINLFFSTLERTVEMILFPSRRTTPIACLKFAKMISPKCDQQILLCIDDRFLLNFLCRYKMDTNSLARMTGFGPHHSVHRARNVGVKVPVPVETLEYRYPAAASHQYRHRHLEGIYF